MFLFKKRKLAQLTLPKEESFKQHPAKKKMTLSINNKANSPFGLKSISFINLKNNKNLKIKGLSPLYFSGKANKSLSKKESFYQYLFIQQIFSSNSANGGSFEGVNFTTQMEARKGKNKTNLLNKKNPTTRIMNLKVFLQDKIFITYRKSFLCYWLLPFLGLVSSFPTLLQSSVVFPLDNSKNVVSNKINPHDLTLNFFLNADEQKKLSINNTIIKNNSERLATFFSSYGLGSNNLLNISTNLQPMENEYSLLLYSKDSSINNNAKLYESSLQSIFKDLLIQDKTNEKSYLNSSQSLLLTVLNLNKSHPTLNLGFSDYNFSILNRNIKSRSKFKWYWFDLSLNKYVQAYSSLTYQQTDNNSPSVFEPNSVCCPKGKPMLNFFPNKISDPIILNGSKKPHSILSLTPELKTSVALKETNLVSADLKNKKSIETPEGGNNFLFLDAILQSTLTSKEKNSISLEDKINQDSIFLKQKLNNQISQNQLKLEIFNKESTKNISSGSFAGLFQKVFERKKDLGKYLGVKTNTRNDNYLIGIVKKDMRVENNFLVKQGASKTIGLNFSNSSLFQRYAYFRDKKAQALKKQATLCSSSGALKKEQNLLLKFKNKKMTPYKSFKKANYLMDCLKINSRIAFLSPYMRTAFIGKNSLAFDSEGSVALKKEQGSVALNSYSEGNVALAPPGPTHLITKIVNSFNDPLAKQTELAWRENPQVLEKTIIFLLKNKKESLKVNLPDLSRSKVLGLSQEAQANSVSLVTQLKKQEIIKLEQSDILYKSIFEGLKDNLSQIIESKANRINAYPSNILEDIKTKKISMLAWQSNSVQETGINELGLVPSNLNNFDEPILQELYNAPPGLGSPNATNFSVYLSPEEKNKALETFLKNKNELVLPKKFNSTIICANVLTLRDPIRGGNLGLFTNFSEAKSTFVKGKNSNLSFAPFLTNTSIYLANPRFASFSRVTSEIGAERGLNKINNKNSKEQIPQDSYLNSVSLKKENKGLSFSNKNSFLFLSKYLGLMTNNIKTILSPYKFRLTYLSEINLFQSKFYSNSYNNKDHAPPGHSINKNKYLLEKDTNLAAFFNKKKLSNLFYKRKQNKNSSLKLEKKIKSNEKIFLSYLSKSKKSSIFLSSFKDYGRNKKFIKSSLQTSFAKESSKRIKWLNKLRLKSKINLSKLDSQNSSFSSNRIQKIDNSSLLESQSLIKNLDKTALAKLENKTKNNNAPEGHSINKPYNPSIFSGAKNAKLLLKNRHFINKEIYPVVPEGRNNFKNYMAILLKNKNALHGDEISSENIRSILINSRLKKQQLKIKRRLKKMKKETRRRKKRKIFYPRPTWIVFSMYKKFLDLRYSPLNGAQNLQSASSILTSRIMPNKKISARIKAAQRTNAINKTFLKLESLFLSKNKQEKYLFWLSKKRYKHASEGQSLNNTKDFYKISRTVFSDLKRVLMKSNWLRSYLNPYLEKVKNIYKEMQNSSKKMSIYENLRSFILFIYGPSGGPFFTTNNLNFFKATQTQVFPMYINIKTSLFEGQTNLFRRETNQKDLENYKLQHSINFLEYNRLVYQRIQRIILNIRENLNLNGQIKNRSKKLSKNIRAFIKRDYVKRDDTGANQNTTLWSKIIKNNLLKLGLAINYNGYDQSVPYNNLIQPSSKNNLYWSLNKSSMLTNTNFHTSYTKKLWETYKIREISKSNKTKKLIFNIMMKYNNISQPTNSLDQTLINILQRSTRNIKYINSLSHMTDQIGIIQNPLDTNLAIAEEPFLKEPITLPAKTYTIKSEQKLINIENKLKLLGVYSQKQQRQYKKAYFRSVTEQLLKMRARSFGYSITNPTLYKLNYSNSNYFGTKLYAQRVYSATDSYWWSSFKIGPAFSFNRFAIKSPNNQFTESSNLDNNNFTFNSSMFNAPLFLFNDGSVIEKRNVEQVIKQETEIKKEISFLSPVTLSSFLFHFCALVSFISLGGVKTLIKFYYILISKISKLSYFAKSLVRFIPKNNSIPGGDRNNSSINSNSLDDLNKLRLLDKQTSLEKTWQSDNNFSSTFTRKIEKIKKETNNKTSIYTLRLYFLKYLTARRAKTHLSLIEQKLTNLALKTTRDNKKSNIKIFKNFINSNAKQNLFSWLETQALSIKKIENYKKYKNGSAILYKNKNNKFLVFSIKTPPGANFKVSTKKSSPTVSLNLKEFHLIFKDLLEFVLFISNFLVLSAKKQNTHDVNGYLNQKILSGGNQIEKRNIYLNKKSLTNVAALTRKLSIFLSLVHKISFYSYLLLLKSVDVLAVPASFIYKFFEKPGEYVVENIAYSFLVEWSADLITTIPDTVDTHVNIYFSKINTRAISPLILINMDLGFQAKLALLNLKTPLNIIAPQGLFLLGLSNSILKGLLNSSLLVFIQQLCEPDLDYINRQKKGIIFWDIWGEYLKKVAEENSINIYELTTDKEEQVKLLSKYEEAIVASEGKKGDLNNEYLGNNFLNTNLYSKYSLYSLNSILASVLRRNHFSLPSKQSLLGIKLTSKTSEAEKYNLALKNSKMNLSGYRNLMKFSSPLNKALNSKIAPPGLANYFFSNKIAPPGQNVPEYKVKQEHGHSLSFFASQKKINKSYANYYGWSVSQFLSYQGKDTDLFIDLHPPKTFSTSAAFLQLRLFSVQQPIGSIVCQIFSGIFYKQISKNILVVGSSGLEKTLLIQAIAGETELKIITDNANRYAMVYRGVAVGIKLLRDVFEALSLHTPCIFLMEDIHAIGERRPFLIDHPTDSNAAESTYNKNQSMQVPLLQERSSASREGLYKNNKHLVSHYKKPYKSGKLLATNHFSFTFLFGDIFTKIRKSEIRPSGIPLPIQVIKKENPRFASKQTPLEKTSKQSGSKGGNLAIHQRDKFNNNIYSSSLLIKSAKDELLAPPASSPFNVLILKEAAKLKHKNLVKEMPWFGLPGEQFSLVSKYNYSIRVKVALLADLVLSNLSVKLDMITDLLVIIDSVKGNRGFVVFATTHVPYILDPALRRPGRFDETISLPLIPALYSRWVNYRYNIQYLTTSLFKKYSIPLNSTFNKGTTLDLTKYNVINSTTLNAPHTMDKLINYIYIKASNVNNTLYRNTHSSSKALKKVDSFKQNNQTSFKSTLVFSNKENHLRRSFTKFKETKSLSNYTAKQKQTEFASITTLHRKNQGKSKLNENFESKLSYTNKVSNKQILQLKSKRYAYACKSLISLMLYTYNNSSNNVQTLHNTGSVSLANFSLKWPSMLREIDNFALQDYSVYLSLFGYPLMLKMILMSLLGGKLGESFASSSNFKRNEHSLHKNKSLLVPFAFFGKQKTQTINNAFLFNFDQSSLDKLGSSLLFSYAEKRQFSTFNKNLLITKLLSFNNKYSLMEAPSPPISNILLPAKRYENYQRTLNNQFATLISQNNFNASVSDKIQLHQQQRLLKRLYKYPIKEFFRSERVERTNIMSNFSNFNAARIILTPLEKTNLASINKLSSVNWCYKNILYNRHKTYLTNQWWTGQLGEHNAETTFLSDIDWRYTFVQSIGDINIDFPDSEQFYNPRNRRWILSNGDWNYWFNIQAELKDIYSHYVYDCFTKAYNYLNQNREIIDFYAEILHQTPLTTELKESDLLNLYKRFFAQKPKKHF